MAYKLNTNVLHSGTEYKSGAVISGEDMSKKDIERLINSGVAVMTNDPVDVEEKPKKAAIIETPKSAVDDLQGAEDLLTDDEVYKEIDEAFNHAEIKREAEVLGMKFPGNISKKDLIDQILKEEKDDHFLDVLDNR